MKRRVRFQRPLRRTLQSAVLGTVVLAGGFIAGLHVAQAAPSIQIATAAIESFQFKPGQIEVKVGTNVVWTNNDDATHTVTSGTPDQRNDLFNATLSGKGASFEFTFTKAGTFTYFCDRHQRMRGEITVKE
jgi:plastocyanin